MTFLFFCLHFPEDYGRIPMIYKKAKNGLPEYLETLLKRMRDGESRMGVVSGLLPGAAA
jgi:hypothetical protein